MTRRFLRSPVALTVLAAAAVLFAAAAVLFAGAAPAAEAAPDFTWDPDPLSAGELATFTPSDIPAGAVVTWDYDGADGVDNFESVNTHTFAAEGSPTVIMRVDDAGTVTDFPKVVAVDDARPVADFDFSPQQPDPGESVLFVSTSSDPDAGDAITSVQWTIDGSPVSTEASFNHTFLTAGPHEVTLTVTDLDASESEVTRTITVSSAPDTGVPAASFTVTPAAPLTGQTVTFMSTSTPSAGNSITSERWDLDGDGVFDDATGGLAATSFASAGQHVVQLQVTQSNGQSDQVFTIFSVAAAPVTGGIGTTATSPTAPPEEPPPAAPAFIAPSPIVRLAGTVISRGTLIKVLAVRAPTGVSATVRCSGRGCPARSSQRLRVSESGRARFKRFERLLKPTARLEIFVRSPGLVGKYTRFRMRASRLPARLDRCLLPGALQPSRCPS